MMKKLISGYAPFEEGNYAVVVNIEENTTVKEFLAKIINKISKKYELDDNIKSFINNDEMNSYINLFYCDIAGSIKFFKSLNFKIKQILDYLENNYEEKFELGFMGGFGAGYDDFHGIKFYTHANEENHKFSPHIHTEYRNDSASYFIMNGEKKDGKKYPSKIEKLIKKKIISEKKVLLQFWLDTTNGLIPYPTPLDIEIRNQD